MVNGTQVHISTGGKELDTALPSVVFLAGAGGDHRTWTLQTRWFAFHGYSVLAPDFPAHGLSAGEPLTSIEESADWLNTLLQKIGVSQVHLVGHSQGFLTVLELASREPTRVLSVTGIGSAAAIPVNSTLIETARKSTAQAADLMLRWSFGPLALKGHSALPGMQPIAICRAVMNATPLAIDLQACADYLGGEAAAAKISQARSACSMILAGQDKMTPLMAGKKTAEVLNAKLTILPEHGHMLPFEAPKEVLFALRSFIESL